jgi:hypothetical protein
MRFTEPMYALGVQKLPKGQEWFQKSSSMDTGAFAARDANDDDSLKPKSKATPS